MFVAVDRFNALLQERGRWVHAGGLVDRSEARVVDARSDSPSVTDGPFSEAREWLGGLWVVEADDLDSAVAIAKEGSAACRGRVEVRALAANDALGAQSARADLGRNVLEPGSRCESGSLAVPRSTTGQPPKSSCPSVSRGAAPDTRATRRASSVHRLTAWTPGSRTTSRSSPPIATCP